MAIIYQVQPSSLAVNDLNNLDHAFIGIQKQYYDVLCRAILLSLRPWIRIAISIEFLLVYWL